MKKSNSFFATIVAFSFIFSTCALAETSSKDQKTTTHQASTSQVAKQSASKKSITKAVPQHKKTNTATNTKAIKNTTSKTAKVNPKKQIAKQSSTKRTTTKNIANTKNTAKPKSAGAQTSSHHLTKNHNKKKVIKQKQTSAT